ncbi:MAG: o-succinylbenzoate synthase [Chitinophagales bacterium]|nr:o-succinylbenzoate synthase [Chitinophagales bacterium]
MRTAYYKPYRLNFKTPVLTSRGRMQVKNGYYLFVTDGKNTGTGECSFIEGLSADDLGTYESTLENLCNNINSNSLPDFSHHPSMAFGYQTAMLDLKNGGNKILFESDFTRGEKSIPINGLVWMGTKEFMHRQILQKLEEGFKCIKLKVGALNFEEEISLLRYIRQHFPKEQIEIRLDANGAFTGGDVFQKLEALAPFHIHSIEQPVKAGQWGLMKKVCTHSPIPVALDEELIGISGEEDARNLLQEINPAYIILKPSLLGGLNVCDHWIALAESLGIGWWATSALESNIGLNAIAQWVFTKNNPMVQGLGTGSLYTNNVQSPLVVEDGMLHYRSNTAWELLS